MTEAAQHTIDYFSAPANYFWRWAEGGEVIEWVDGTTICYRDELAELLKGLDEECLPPLSCILLVLAACNDNWQPPLFRVKILQAVIVNISTPGESGFQLHAKLHSMNAATHLGTINDLPKHLRKGESRKHLLRQIFHLKNSTVKQGTVEEFCGGSLHELIITGHRQVAIEDYTEELHLLANIKTPSAEALELKLRTGITEIPKPLTELAILQPDAKPLSLLEQLADEPKAAGISRLAKRIIAALNIPMHSQGSSSQPYGGISDVTNRGSFDRLLLSELAHDDVSLTARLVNNEALYLRREQPPHNPKKQRIILIDTSIKMWGLPRVFAVSAAIACTLNTKHKEVVEAFTLTGSGFADEDLTTKAGVVATLEKVDNSLYCAAGLDVFLQQTNIGGETDIMFITHDAFVHTAVFQKLFATAGDNLNYIITVNRAGELVFNEVVNNNIKKISSAKFDLDELLSAPATAPAKRKVKEEIELPAFYQQRHQPLFFPTTGMRMTPKNVAHNYKTGLYGITESQRLLHWPGKETGARELLRFVEAGDYGFGFENNTLQYLLVKCSMDRGVKLYRVDINDPGYFEEHDISAPVKVATPFLYHQQFFYVRTRASYNENTMVISCKNPASIKYEPNRVFDDIYKKTGRDFTSRPFNEYKKIINNGYNVLHRVHEIFVNEAGRLSLDYNEITIDDKNVLVLMPQKSKIKNHKHRSSSSLVIQLRSNPNMWLRKYTWPNGSYAIIDSNGLAHFRSSNTNLPEFTVVLILNKPTACWASDGNVWGSPYFTGNNSVSKLYDRLFYNKYIQPFIDNLK